LTEVSASRGQTMMEDKGDPRPVASALCAWRSSQATKRLETEPAIKGSTKDGVPVVKKRAIVVPVCQLHFERFEREKDRHHQRKTEKAQKRRALRKKL
jgi:hypothetical protein